MGTRSNVIIEKDGRVLACIYRQYDGYPSGIGASILKALNGGEVELRNGFHPGDATPAQFNGMGCLAAYLVGKLKGDSIGSVYLCPTDHKPGAAGEDYAYTLSAKDGVLHLVARNLCGDPPFYSGPLKDFNPSPENKTKIK